MNCKMAGSLNDGYSTDYCKAFNFTTSWTDVSVEFKPTSSNNIIILQCGDFVGDVFIKNIKDLLNEGVKDEYGNKKPLQYAKHILAKNIKT